MALDRGDVADQRACTEIVVETTPDAAIVSNLGTNSYTLIDVADRDRNFYLTGAMGVTTPVGFGLALAISDPVVVLDGDGSLLMSLGALATVGTYDPPNLTIVVFDNGTFETTGGQPTLSAAGDFATVAREYGIASWSVGSTADFADAYGEAVEHDGAALVSCAVEPYAPDEHPPLDYGHAYRKHRFREAVAGESRSR